MLFIGNFLRARERGTLFDSQQSMREASAQYNNLSAEEKLVTISSFSGPYY